MPAIAFLSLGMMLFCCRCQELRWFYAYAWALFISSDCVTQRSITVGFVTSCGRFTRKFSVLCVSLQFSHELEKLQQQTFIMLWSGIWARRGPLARAVSQGCNQHVTWGCSYLQTHLGEGPSFQAHSVGPGRIRFLTGCSAEGLSSSLAVSLRPQCLAMCASPWVTLQHGSWVPSV